MLEREHILINNKRKEKRETLKWCVRTMKRDTHIYIEEKKVWPFILSKLSSCSCPLGLIMHVSTCSSRFHYWPKSYSYISIQFCPFIFWLKISKFRFSSILIKLFHIKFLLIFFFFFVCANSIHIKLLIYPFRFDSLVDNISWSYLLTYSIAHGIPFSIWSSGIRASLIVVSGERLGA